MRKGERVAAVCHAEPISRVLDGQIEETTVGARVVLDRMQTWQGTRAKPVENAEVENWITQAAYDYRAEVVLDPWTLGTGTRDTNRPRGRLRGAGPHRCRDHCRAPHES